MLYIPDNNSYSPSNDSSDSFEIYVSKRSLIFSISVLLLNIISLTIISAGEYLEISSNNLAKLLCSTI